jgi:hypothetical protein
MFENVRFSGILFLDPNRFVVLTYSQLGYLPFHDVVIKQIGLSQLDSAHW